MNLNELGFIILSPDHNIGGLKGTVRSIINNYSTGTKIICVTEKGVKSDVFKEMNGICKTYKGGETITSLMNAGLEKGHEDWNIIVMEGSWVKGNLHEKYSRWINSHRDVLYSIYVSYDREGFPSKIYKDFDECSLNGLCINRKLFKEVGKFSDNPLGYSKLFWAMDAVEKNAQFKGILGVKII